MVDLRYILQLLHLAEFTALTSHLLITKHNTTSRRLVSYKFNIQESNKERQKLTISLLLAITDAAAMYGGGL